VTKARVLDGHAPDTLRCCEDLWGTLLAASRRAANALGRDEPKRAAEMTNGVQLSFNLSRR